MAVLPQRVTSGVEEGFRVFRADSAACSFWPPEAVFFGKIDDPAFQAHRYMSPFSALDEIKKQKVCTPDINSSLRLSE
jgi:hypothetical protein